MKPAIRARSRSSGEGSQSRSPSGIALDSRWGRPLDRGHRIVLGGPGALLAGIGPEAARQLAAQVARLDHGVDDELGRQVQDVDLLGVLAPQLLGAGRPLVVVLDPLELVEE